jgi:hypothetical protein
MLETGSANPTLLKVEPRKDMQITPAHLNDQLLTRVPGGKENFLNTQRENYERLKHELPYTIDYSLRTAPVAVNKADPFVTRMVGPHYDFEDRSVNVPPADSEGNLDILSGAAPDSELLQQNGLKTPVVPVGQIYQHELNHAQTATGDVEKYHREVSKNYVLSEKPIQDGETYGTQYPAEYLQGALSGLNSLRDVTGRAMNTPDEVHYAFDEISKNPKILEHLPPENARIFREYLWLRQKDPAKAEKLRQAVARDSQVLADSGEAVLPDGQKVSLYRSYEEKQAAEVLPRLKEIKRMSDAREYTAKAEALRALMQAAPENWVVDSDDPESPVLGLTHQPTGFRFHLPRERMVPGLQLGESNREPDKQAAATPRRKAVLITGNPYYLNGPDKAGYDNFYAEIEALLNEQGYQTSRDPGEPFTEPPAADLWVGHSRGADRLRFAPPGIKTVVLDQFEDGYAEREAENLRLMQEAGYKNWADWPLEKRPQPDSSHYTVTDAMRAALVDNPPASEKQATQPGIAIVSSDVFDGTAGNVRLSLGDDGVIQALGDGVPDPETAKVISHAELQQLLAAREKQKQAASAATANPVNSFTGPGAIAHALSRLDPQKLREEQMEVIRSKRVTKRPRAVAVLNALEGLERNNLRPQDLMVSRVPVIPPVFRPFRVIGDAFSPGDENELYRDLFAHREALESARKEFGDTGVAEARLALYDATKALYGWGDTQNPKLEQRGVSGLLKKLTGTSPKTGWVNRKMVSKPVDTVARGTATVDPELTMDEIGIPEELAWKIYGQHAIRYMVRRMGFQPAQAIKAMKERTKDARYALNKDIEDRPVVYSRAPSWHKFNVIAGKAKIVEGDAIQVNPYVTTGLNADFNGDDQIGRILLIAPKKMKLRNRSLCLMSPISEDIVGAMISKHVIPAFDTTTHQLFLPDLSDFPRTDLQRHKPNGKNGVIDFYNVPEGLQVVAFDAGTGKPVWAPVAYYSVHPQREVEIVDLSNGRQIVTDDDPRAVYGIAPEDPTFEPGRFSPDEALRRQVLVPVVRDVAGACQNLQCISEIAIGDRTAALDYDLGYLLGALAGDGWWDKRDYRGVRRVYLADLKGQVAARCYGVLKKLFGAVGWGTFEQTKETNDSRYGDSVRHTFSFEGAKGFSEFLSQWLGGQASENSSGSATKSLPDFFMLAPEEFRVGLLSGLVDTDGSVSVSNAKSKPQLLCAVTSTSFRLICDTRYLCLTLGLQAFVGFSKTTVRGNTSWICTISAVDAKNKNVFTNLATDSKRNAFLTTEVDREHLSQAFDKVPVPPEVYELVLKDLPSPKIRKHERIQTQDLDTLDAKKHAQNMYVQWWKTKESNLVPRSFVARLISYLETQRKDAEALRARAVADMLTDDPAFTKERAQLWRSAILAACPVNGDPAKYKEAYGVYATLNRPLKLGRCSTKVRERVCRWLLQTPPYQNALTFPVFQQWVRRFVDNTTVAWASVTAVQKTGVREDGYDLTVPGFETFMSADGVILSNTLNIHTPATHDAVQEAKDTLMASKMVWSTREHDKLMPVPKHEALLGLHSAKVRPAMKSHAFPSKAEALKAVQSGRVSLSDEISFPGA